MRSNWRVYLEEFQLAVEALAEGISSGEALQRAASRRLPCEITELRLSGEGDEAISNFEGKFHRNGNRLWRLDLQG